MAMALGVNINTLNRWMNERAMPEGASSRFSMFAAALPVNALLPRWWGRLMVASMGTGNVSPRKKSVAIDDITQSKVVGETEGSTLAKLHAVWPVAWWSDSIFPPEWPPTPAYRAESSGVSLFIRRKEKTSAHATCVARDVNVYSSAVLGSGKTYAEAAADCRWKCAEAGGVFAAIARASDVEQLAETLASPLFLEGDFA